MTNPNDDVIDEFRANSGTVTQAMGGALVGLDLVLLHHPYEQRTSRPFPVVRLTPDGERG
jgi:hypothetical protein